VSWYYLRDKFHHLKARMGTKKAAMVVAHKILVAIFHMFQRGIAFVDLGGNYLDGINKNRTARRLVRRLPSRLRGHASASSCRIAINTGQHWSPRGPPSEFSGQPIAQGCLRPAATADPVRPRSRYTSHAVSGRHLLVRLQPTSLRPDPPLSRASRASAVQEAAQRHRRRTPARSVLDSASTVLQHTAG